MKPSVSKIRAVCIQKLLNSAHTEMCVYVIMALLSITPEGDPIITNCSMKGSPPSFVQLHSDPAIKLLNPLRVQIMW